MKASIAASILAFAAAATASPAKSSPMNFFSLTKRASLPIPASAGSETLSEAMEISGTFDGGLKTYGRGVSCTGQEEGDDSDAVFLLKDGATLKNVIIGEDQIEGVHCGKKLDVQMHGTCTDMCFQRALAPSRTSVSNLSVRTAYETYTDFASPSSGWAAVCEGKLHTYPGFSELSY